MGLCSAYSAGLLSRECGRRWYEGESGFAELSECVRALLMVFIALELGVIGRRPVNRRSRSGSDSGK